MSHDYITLLISVTNARDGPMSFPWNTEKENDFLMATNMKIHWFIWYPLGVVTIDQHFSHYVNLLLIPNKPVKRKH